MRMHACMDTCTLQAEQKDGVLVPLLPANETYASLSRVWRVDGAAQPIPAPYPLVVELEAPSKGLVALRFPRHNSTADYDGLVLAFRM